MDGRPCIRFPFEPNMYLPGLLENERVLVLEPGSDASIVKAIIQAGIRVEVCHSMTEIAAKAESAGGALVAAEAITPGDKAELRQLRRREPAWSDFPFLVLVRADEPRFPDYPGELGNISLLERPLHPETLVSALRSALWSRRHQFEMRDFLLNQQRTVEQLDGLAELAGRLLMDENPENLGGLVAEKIGKPLGIDIFVFREFDARASKFHVRSHGGITEEEALQFGKIRWAETVVLRVVREKKPCVFENVQATTDPNLSLLRALGVEAWVCHPLISGEYLIGTLCFGTRANPRFHHDGLAIIDSACNQLATAIARKRAERELHELNMELNRRVEERTAEYREMVEQLEAFSYSIAHDLRAPLRAIRVFSQTLLEDYSETLDPVVLDLLRRIDGGGSRMDVLIRDLLEYSRMGRSELSFEPLALDELVNSVVAQCDLESGAVRPQIEVFKPLGRVLGHAATVRQALLNVVGNAVKFVAPGVQPRIRIRSEHRGNDCVRLWVEDNGIGIPAEHQQRIFGVFERLHTGEDYPGTGIGLAIVAKGIRRMGGAVGVESVPGQGSRFWVELPEAPA